MLAAYCKWSLNIGGWKEAIKQMERQCVGVFDSQLNAPVSLLLDEKLHLRNN